MNREGIQNFNYLFKCFKLYISCLFVFYRSSFLCDVVLIVNGTEFPAHKIMLASCSPYFHAMFTCFEESKQHKVVLKDIDSKALELLLEYIYTSKVQITEDNVQVRSNSIFVAIDLSKLLSYSINGFYRTCFQLQIYCN